jgi:aspartate racemase
MNEAHCPARTLGLLGGMGPAATVDVLDKIIKATPARRDQDHVPIIVRCIPQIPDRTEALLTGGPSPREALVQGAQALRAAGADVLAMACNTAHHWYAEVCDAFGATVLHIADAVVDELACLEATGPLGLMATGGTLASGFYQDILGEAGYPVLLPTPEEQTGILDLAIAAAKSSDWHTAHGAASRAAQTLFDRGARQIVLACTELPVAMGSLVRDFRLIDANLALARACVRASLGNEAAQRCLAA